MRPETAPRQAAAVKNPCYLASTSRKPSVGFAQQPSNISDNMTSCRQIDIFQGTLDLLILRTLRTESMHGLAILERILQVSEGVLQLIQGSLSPALHRRNTRDGSGLGGGSRSSAGVLEFRN
jgi:hypothetical protein